MTDDLVKRLRRLDTCIFPTERDRCHCGEAADRIEHLENRCANLLVGNGILNIHIEKLEAALRTVKEWHGYGLPPETTRMIDAALEGKDD